MRNFAIIILIIVFYSCSSKDKKIEIVNSETEIIDLLINEKIENLRQVKEKRPNPRVKLYLEIAETLNSSSNQLIETLNSQNLNIESSKELFVNHLNLFFKRTNFLDYRNPYENIIENELVNLNHKTLNQFVRKIKVQELLLIDNLTDSLFNGYIPLNKFFIEKINNSIYLSVNDSTQFVKVLIETKKGFDTLMFDNQNGLYHIESKQYGEKINGKIQYINFDNRLIEYHFVTENK
jgi:hypothetical protein